MGANVIRPTLFRLVRDFICFFVCDSFFVHKRTHILLSFLSFVICPFFSTSVFYFNARLFFVT